MNQPAQDNPKGRSRGAAVAKLGGVVCVGSMIFGVICMLGIIAFGDPERPSELFGVMGGLSCGLFTAGLLLGFAGWIMLVNSSDPSKHAPPPERKKDASKRRATVSAEAEAEEAASEPTPPADKKPQPYEGEHRRR